MMHKLSVIVPIYNAEKYLEECLESIKNQDYKNMEIILVDDGSTDSSPSICDDFKSKNENVVVIHKKNGGCVSSRKAGLKIASGDYVTYVDADDFIDHDLYSKAMDICDNENPCILCYGFCEYDENGIKKTNTNPIKSGIYVRGTTEYINLQKNALYIGKYFEAGMMPSVWSKIFQKDLLTEIQYKIDDSITMGEDASVTYSIIMKSEKIIVKNEIKGYNYRTVGDSMSRSFDKQYFYRAKTLFSYLESTFSSSEFESLYKIQFNAYKLFIVEYGLNKLTSFYGRKRILKLLKEAPDLYDKFTPFNIELPDDFPKHELTKVINKNKYSSFFVYILRLKFMSLFKREYDTNCG